MPWVVQGQVTLVNGTIQSFATDSLWLPVPLENGELQTQVEAFVVDASSPQLKRRALRLDKSFLNISATLRLGDHSLQDVLPHCQMDIDVAKLLKSSETVDRVPGRGYMVLDRSRRGHCFLSSLVLKVPLPLHAYVYSDEHSYLCD